MPIDLTLSSRVRSISWWRLHDHTLLDFYAALHRQNQASGEDWQPMVELICHVRSMDGALRLFGFISQHRLYLTTASRYVDCAGHHSIFIAWEPRLKSYHLGYGSLDHGLGAEAEEEVHVLPETLAPALDPMLQRLLAVP